MNDQAETIAAIATPPGRGGVGIVRISGSQAERIGRNITGCALQPRYAHFTPFYDSSSATPQLLDQGIAIFFPAPHSFTGETVVELQGHGGPVILDCILREVLRLGARAARPGEFSERAYLNDKIDLAQAEAIADLIDSSSEQAARSAVRSLSGAFSREIHVLVEALTQLRIYVEAAIDFPEEEIDFLHDGHVAGELERLLALLSALLRRAQQGSLLREGMTVVIAGRPNAGKSSLLNALAGRESAIVTAIAGTTRDILREHIQIDGMPLHIIDTAGLRESPDEVEREGIRRAWCEIEQADHILLVVDSADLTRGAKLIADELWPADAPIPLPQKSVTLVLNKSDVSGWPVAIETGAPTAITLSARSGEGLDLLRDHLKASVGFQATAEGVFIARRRHVDALRRTQQLLLAGREQLESTGAGELLAEDLKTAQRVLGEITGTVSADELLGRIFSSFCIGK